MSDQFTNYIADIITSAIAHGAESSSDFIMRQGDDLVYVDVEGGCLWLISIREAHAIAGGEDE
jgi:hypothetical protein